MNPGPSPSDPVEDARIARTRADVGRAALEVLDPGGLGSGDACPRRGEGRLLEDHPVHRLAVEGRPDRHGSRRGRRAKHHDVTWDPRADLIGELILFRNAVRDMRLDRILLAMAQSAGVDEMNRTARTSTAGVSTWYATSSPNCSPARDWRQRYR